MQDSICPKGWGLPINGDAQTTKSWINLLFTSYSLQDNGDSSTSARKTPLSLVYSGIYSWVNGGLYYRGSYGRFWSSTPNSTTFARSLNFYSAHLAPQGGYNKVDGFSIRCVERQSFQIYFARGETSSTGWTFIICSRRFASFCRMSGAC